MSYNFNSIPTVPPTGSVAPFTGTTDPSGWIICDGISRSNASGQYNNLINALSISTNPTWTNYGISQTINALSSSITLADVRGVAVSDIGTLLLADRASNRLYISNNNGVSWSAISGLPSISFSCVDISQDGTQMLASANVIGYGLYVSSSSGANWRQLYTANGLPTDLIANDFGSNKIAISNDGTKISVAYTNGFTYFSSNSGATFQNVSPPSATGNTQGGLQVAKNYWGLGMSKDGTKLVAAVNNGSYVPNINNIVWTTNPGTGFVSGQGYWNASLSYTGQYVLVNGSATYISSNYGNNWFTASGPTTIGFYLGGAVSATGQYMYSGDYNGAAYISSSYGQYWKTSPTGLSAVGGYASGQFSNTGQYVAVGNRNGGPWLSTNFGNSFTQLNSFNADTYYGAGISATGQYIIFGGTNNTYISSNYGVNWTINPTGNTGGYFVSISGNGQYMLSSKEAGNTNTVVSSNYGKSFTQTTVVPSFAISVNFVSYTGQFMMAAVGNNNSGPIYFSSSYGVDWVQNPGTGLAASNNYRGLSMSANAQYMLVAPQSGGNIYFARNPYWTGTGATFNTTNWLSGPAFNIYSLIWSTNPGTGLPGTGNWYGGASISYSGQYMIMANWNSSVYLSNNYGQTWTIPSGTGSTTGASISGTGQYMVTGGNNVYVSTTYGQNWYIALTGQSNYRSGISGSGQYILTGGSSVFYSSNYGVSFNSVPTISPYAYPSLSATGQYMAFPGNANHNLSTSYGLYWTTFASIGTSISSCISANGQYIAFGTSSSILLSTTYGASFYTTNSSVNAQQMSISYSGQYIAAANSGTGMIVMSSNYGINWTTSLGTGLAGSGGYAIAISGNAQYMLSGASTVYLSSGLSNIDGGISYSSDSGNNWSFGGGYLNGPYHNSVAISADGSTMLAGYQDGQPYLSTGSSNTFNQLTTVPNYKNHTYTTTTTATGTAFSIPSNGGTTTASYTTWTSGSYTYVATASSIRNNEANYWSPVYSFNYSNTSADGWLSSPSKYNTLATGLYIGSVTTSNIIGGDVSSLMGEWLQLQVSSGVVLNNYTFLQPNEPTRNPRFYYILGSNDGTNWTAIQSVNYTSTTTYASLGYARKSTPVITTYNNIGFTRPLSDFYGITDGSYGAGTYKNYPGALNSFAYYRIVINKIQGSNGLGDTAIHIIYMNITPATINGTTTQYLNNSYGMSLSNTGQYGIVTQNNGKIYYTLTTGSTWQTSPSTLADDFYAGAYVSGNGQYMVAAADGNLYTSSSSVTFTPITIPSITSTDGTTVNYIIKI